MTPEQHKLTYLQRMQIREVLHTLKPELAIGLIESIGTEFRRKNSAKINHKQMGRVVVDERPDELMLKEK